MVEWKKLGDICDIKGRIGFRGYTREDQVDKGEGAISLSPGNISDDSLNYDSCTYITWTKYEESPEIMVSEGDIILGKTASVGKVARIKRLPEKATINPQLVLLKNISINPQYLFYVLSDSSFQKTIKGLAGVGSVPNVSQAKLSQILIPVPNPSEQERIEKLLDTFTSSIENLKEQIAERRKQYEYYRDQLLDLEGKDGVEMKTLGQLCELVTKQTGFDYSSKIKPALLTAPQKGAIPYLQTKNFTGRDFDYKTDYYVPEHIVNQFPKIVLDKKCLLFSIVGASIGNVGLFPGKNKCFLGGAICVLKFKDFVNIHFVYEVMTSWIGQKQIKEKTKGAGQATITVEDARNFVIPFPKSDVQSKIVSILDTFEESIQNLEAQLSQREKQYEYYRNKLLTFEE